jgi:single-strand DNA-binding protein
MSVNKVILIGNLGRDPEMRYATGGNAIASLNIATTRKWRNKDSGEMQEETEWHRVAAFGKTAENCNRFLTKGKSVYVEGRIRTRSYDDKDGVKKYATEIIAERVEFLGGRGDGEQRDAPTRGRGGSEPYDPGDYSGPEDDPLPF